MSDPPAGAILEARALSKRWRLARGHIVEAVGAVDLAVKKGEAVGLVGESGCGKTTLAKMLVRLVDPSSGSILFDGADITHLRNRALLPFRRRMQLVFQDPYASLNPRATVGLTISEALRFHRIVPDAEVSNEVSRLLDLVGLRGDLATHYPHQLSGGQRQRVGIARALSVRPELIIADEPVSALDVSIRAQILNLLADLRERLHLTLLFISHDLAAVEWVTERVLVMQSGQIVEEVPSDGVRERAKHPYTRKLLDAIPRLPDAAQR